MSVRPLVAALCLPLVLFCAQSHADLWRFSAVGTAGIGSDVSAGEALTLSFEYDDGLFGPGQLMALERRATGGTSYWRYQYASAIPVSLQGSVSGALSLDPISAFTLSRSGSGDVIGLGPVSLTSNGYGYFYCPVGDCDDYREIDSPSADNFVDVHALLAGQFSGELESADIWGFFSRSFDYAQSVDINWTRVGGGGSTSVPEPPVVLLLAGALLAWRYRRHGLSNRGAQPF